MENINLSFEDALKRIEEIVAKLESNEATLDESLKLYEEAVSLSAFCNDSLKNAKEKIEKYSKVCENGEKND